MNKIKNILSGNIWLKISFFNSFGVFSRVISGWIINKLIAVFIGPQGTTLSEQLRNFIQSLEGISTLGIQEGVTKYGAKYEHNSKQLQSFLSTAYKIVLITSLITGFVIFLLANKINNLLFPGYNFVNIIKISAVILPVAAMNMVLKAILRGFQQYKKITYIGVSSNVIVTILAIFLIYKYQLTGALFLVLLTQVAGFFITLFYIQKDFQKIFKFSFNNTDKKHYKRLYAYILMAIISSLVVPVFNILIRNLIFTHYQGDLGVHAGYWDAVKKISGLFLSLILPVFSLYYYPQLSKIHTNIELKREIKNFLKQIFPYFTLGILLLYLFRKFALLIFFSDAYLASENLFLWQLAGDYLRVLSMTLAFLMLAKAHVRKYITLEVGFWVIYYFLSYYLLGKYELCGVTLAYFLAYVFYLTGLILIYKKYLFSDREIIIK